MKQKNLRKILVRHAKIILLSRFVNGTAMILMSCVLSSCCCASFLVDVAGSPDVQPTGVAFFESAGGWDYQRIPLIEPYQAITSNKETWSINLRTDSIRYQWSVGPTELDVIDNRAIITYCTNCILGGERVDELWFIIIPEENIERGFTKEEEFLTYLKDKGIDNPNLTDVNELYKELVNKGYLEWFPEKYRE